VDDIKYVEVEVRAQIKDTADVTDVVPRLEGGLS
jgi:hypothetical protein